MSEDSVGLVLGPVLEAEAKVLELDVAALEEDADELAPPLQVEVHQLHLWRRGGGGRHHGGFESDGAFEVCRVN